jgi:hypothetical protein
LRPDGQELRWQIGSPTSPDLPFLCADVTPRELRVPSGAAWQHSNGVTGLTAVTVAVNNLAESAGHYRALLGSEPQATAGNTAVFPLASTGIRLVEAASLPGYRPERGEGPYALTLHAPSGTANLDAALTHGAKLDLSQAQE